LIFKSRPPALSLVNGIIYQPAASVLRLAFVWMETKLEQQIAQQFAPIKTALQAADKCAEPLRAIGKQLAHQVATLTRAQVFLFEQYQKSARAKKKKAHAHLVAICQSVANKLRRFVSLREVAAEFYKHTAEDMRTTLRELLSAQHQANAPNSANSSVFRTHLEVALTT
jgi:hypothetical protein